jgi:putative transposase
MRHNQSTLKATQVHAYAQRLLQQTLELEGYKPVLPLGLVVSVLLLAACWQTSLTGACRLVKARPSHHHVRQDLYGCLPRRPRELLDRLLALLRQSLPDSLGRTPRVMAVDLHQRPYYGKKNTKGCTQRQKKASTRKSFTYATLAVLDRSGRFTVGLVATRPTMRLSTVVERLLAQAGEAGLSIAYLMLDKEFYAAEVIALLQQHRVPFLMPARRKGSKPGAGNQHLFAASTPVGWYDYTWTTRLRRLDAKTKKRRKAEELTVQVRLCVAHHQSTGKPLVYASWALGANWSAAQVVQAYRKRFGIEVKYRQLGQCLARTSSRNERLRLLLVGVALLLCNLWAWLHSELFSTGPLGQRQLHLGLLRLAELIAAVAAVAANLLGGYLDEWPLQRPLPSCFTSHSD